MLGSQRRPMRFLLHFRVRALAVAALALATTLGHAATVRTDHVTAELVADGTALVPGTTTTVALRLAIDRGWHTYWRNPGESGLPTTLAWRLPPGYAAGDIAWPAPKALSAGPLVNYGYEGEVFHLVPLTVPAGATLGATATLAARADWLVCKETCVPESADLSLDLPVAREAAPSRWHDAIAATQAALPQPLPASWSAQATANGARIALALTAPANARDPGALQFFAYDERRIEASAPQVREAGGRDRFVLDLPVSHELKGEFAALRGVLRAANGFTTGAGTVDAVSVDVPITGTPVAGPKPRLDAGATLAVAAPAQANGSSMLPIALLFALAGGLLLNLMPCVFPILSLKALGLAAADGRDRRALRAEGVAFAAGVLVAFAALGLVLLALRAGGAQLGWGFQLQSPAVVTGLAILFFVIAQNLSGVFEFGAWLPSRVATWTHANRHVDAFASGLLAVIVASPCTAPFMGAALGYALTAPVASTLGIFVALGVGMALPYFLLAWFPRWRRLLPRPGPWLVRLRQILAFPLYATVAWLVWVLAAQVGTDAVLRIGLVLVLVALALFAWRAWRGAGRPAWSLAGAVAVVAATVAAWPLLTGAAPPPDTRRTEAGSSGWQPYTPARVSALVAEGRPVFVDFTAAWCITCQVNERFVLNDARVRAAFARNDVALVRADWTRRDPVITQALADLGRNGVPVYVIYRKGRPPQLLPEVLARETVIGALAS